MYDNQGPSPLTCECPFARADRCDGSGLGDEPAPGVAGGLDDLLVGVEDAVREPSLAQILPDVFDGVQLRGARWQQDDGDVLWDVEGACLRFRSTAKTAPRSDRRGLCSPDRR